LIGVNTCGGCPGKKAATRVKETVKRVANTIVVASCITKGNTIGFTCPHVEKMRNVIQKSIIQYLSALMTQLYYLVKEAVYINPLERTE
jgi:predicted metal-binding protein